MSLDTVYLDPVSWDLALDVNGNIALANAPYSIAQDVASAARLQLGEAIYDVTVGVDYNGVILGKLPPINIVASMYDQAAETVPDVITSQTVLLYNSTSRTLTGQIQLSTNFGVISVNV